MPESKWKKFEPAFFLFFGVLFGVLFVVEAFILLRGSALAYLALSSEQQDAAIPGTVLAIEIAMLWGAMLWGAMKCFIWSVMEWFEFSKKKEVKDDVSG